ncbi:MAG: MFS transporter, partial [Actinomycetes bacterium]
VLRRTTGAYASLRVPNFRYYLGGQLVAVLGNWIQQFAQDWQALELSGYSAVALGTVLMLQFAPILLLSLWAGGLADRWDKRRLLLAAHVGLVLIAAVQGLLTVTRSIEVEHVYVLALAWGFLTTLAYPARHRFIPELVGEKLEVNANELNNLVFNVSRFAGPALAGLLVAAVGTGSVFLISAAGYLAPLVALLVIKPAGLHRAAPTERASVRLRDVLRHIRQKPDLIQLLTLGTLGTALGVNFHLTLPLLAGLVFHSGPASFGLLTSAVAAGAILAGLVRARSSGDVPRLRTVVLAAIALGVSQTAAAFMPNLASAAAVLVLAGAVLVLAGAATTAFTISASTLARESVPESMRGRLIGLYRTLTEGAVPLVAPLFGVIGHVLGGRA